MTPLIAYGVLAGASWFVSMVLTSWSIGVAFRHKALEMPSADRIHKTQTPNLGWIGIWGGWIVPLAAVAVFVFAWESQTQSQNPYVAGMLRKMPTMVGVAAVGVLATLFGLLDDRRRLSALSKVLMQILLSGLLCCLGIRVTLFGPALFSIPLTVMWSLCVMNAVNLLDNWDGACAGVALIACCLFFLVAALLGQYFIALILAAMIGSLGGFLVFNFPPAKIFMGNAGSFFIGTNLAALTILETFYQQGAPSHLAVLMPLFLLAVPLYDTASVILIRLRKGAPIHKGDTNHFAHRLQRLGLSDRQVVCVLYGITACTGLCALLLPFITATRWAIFLLGCCLALLAATGLWEWSSLRERNAS